jgi:hypothetical protein
MEHNEFKNNYKATLKRAQGELHNAIEALHVAITTSGFTWALDKAEEHLQSANRFIEGARTEYDASKDH